MEELPSKTREDTLPTHDYLSIAVEFDNGQDMTYFWSSELPVDMGFRCPIPSWAARETHVVARSGLGGLGQWFDEERDVYADYVANIGSPVPGNIVRVWLIAVSLFQHSDGRCQYAGVSFATRPRGRAGPLGPAKRPFAAPTPRKDPGQRPVSGSHYRQNPVSITQHE